ADDPAEVLAVLDRAIDRMKQGRLGPVLFEVPLDVLRALDPNAGRRTLPLPAPVQPAPPATDIAALANVLKMWRKPLLLVGGGVIASQAGGLLDSLARRLGAPVLHTLMGKSALPGDHPLAAGLTWHRATSDVADMAEHFSPLFGQADGVLAIGCRFSQASTG